MPFVPVPKDLTKVKTKIALNLTKRQLVCFSAAAAVGVPIYLVTKGTIGSSAAVFLMIGLMLPFFFLAMFEKDGQPAEKLLRNLIRVKLRPGTRPYRTDNLYHYLNKEGQSIANQNKTAASGSPRDLSRGARGATGSRRQTGKGKPRRR
jgi:hypothetical protein